MNTSKPIAKPMAKSKLIPGWLIGMLVITMALSGCSSTPPPANWKMNAVSLLEHAQQRWLEGDSKTAELALANARKEVAQSGRIDLLARTELSACASKIAGLDFSACSGFDQLATDASANDQAYARFLAGNWSGLDAKMLPPHYTDLLSAKDDSAANRAAVEIKEALPRLIAIGLLFRAERANPTSMNIALDTASERGWRRPLLAWLEVHKARAQKSGDAAAAAALQRRIDLVMGDG
jgi:hypothetical protein